MEMEEKMIRKTESVRKKGDLTHKAMKIKLPCAEPTIIRTGFCLSC